nr:MAG TPA: hypothetical protein [Caudoviricetes sp.]
MLQKEKYVNCNKLFIVQVLLLILSFNKRQI